MKHPKNRQKQAKTRFSPKTHVSDVFSLVSCRLLQSRCGMERSQKNASRERKIIPIHFCFRTFFWCFCFWPMSWICHTRAGFDMWMTDVRILGFIYIRGGVLGQMGVPTDMVVYNKQKVKFLVQWRLVCVVRRKAGILPRIRTSACPLRG